MRIFCNLFSNLIPVEKNANLDVAFISFVGLFLIGFSIFQDNRYCNLTLRERHLKTYWLYTWNENALNAIYGIQIMDDDNFEGHSNWFKCALIELFHKLYNRDFTTLTAECHFGL